MLWNGMIMLLVVMIQKLFVKIAITEELEKLKKIANAKKCITQGTRTYKENDVFVSVNGEYKEKSEMSKHLKDLDRENNEVVKYS